MKRTKVVINVNGEFTMSFEVFAPENHDPRILASAHLAALTGRRHITKEWSI